jgi:hypothetical protein
MCKLCNGNATISWSPMYDPIAINPCVCPTCEGNRFLLPLYFLFLLSFDYLGLSCVEVEFAMKLYL